jgi:hypothetical protein
MAVIIIAMDVSAGEDKIRWALNDVAGTSVETSSVR